MKEKLVDLHIHTKFPGIGSDSRMSFETAATRAVEVGLVAVAITNHDHPSRDHSLKEGLLTLSGVEFTTISKRGKIARHFPHVLMVNLSNNAYNDAKRFSIPFHLPTLKEALTWARNYPEALVIAPHPSPKGNLISLTFDEIRQYREYFDAIEVINGGAEVLPSGEFTSPTTKQWYKERLALALELDLTPVANSDAHKASSIGKVATIIFDNPQTTGEIMTAVKEGACNPIILAGSEAFTGISEHVTESGVIYASSAE